MSIYLDNAATSYPKPKEVAEEVYNYISNIGCNTSRSTFSSADIVDEVIFDTREEIADLFNFNNSSNVIFTKNVTESLNTVILGLIEDGDHVIVTPFEHNSVMRTLNNIKNSINIEFDRIDYVDNNIDINSINKLIKKNTKLIIATHASNVSGSIIPIKEIGKIARERNIIFVVDVAQTAGIIDINMQELFIDALCFTGHKGLMGPQGIGGFIINDKVAKLLRPLITGGTGSFSDTEFTPDILPDRFEAGTPNIPGIFGLRAGIKYIKNVGIRKIYDHEMKLTKVFLDEISKEKRVKIIGENSIKNRLGVISLDFINMDNAVIAYRLSNEYDIANRCGMHCSPNSHKVLGTFPQGTVRISFGYFNTLDDVDRCIVAIKNIIESY